MTMKPGADVMIIITPTFQWSEASIPGTYRDCKYHHGTLAASVGGRFAVHAQCFHDQETP
jgi:hypothetical protein